MEMHNISFILNVIHNFHAVSVKFTIAIAIVAIKNHKIYLMVFNAILYDTYIVIRSISWISYIFTS